MMYNNPVNFNDIAYNMNFTGDPTRFYGMGGGPMAYNGVGSSGLNPTGAQYAQMIATNNMHADIRSRLALYDRRPDAFARFTGGIYGGRDGANAFSSALGKMPMLRGLSSMAINSLASMTGTSHIFGNAPSDFGGGVLSMLHQNRQLNFSYMDSHAQTKMAADMSRQLYNNFYNSSGISNMNTRGFSGKQLNQMLELGVSSGAVNGISFEKSGPGYKLSQDSIKNMQSFVADSAEMFRELTDVFDSRDLAELSVMAEKLTGQSLRNKDAVKKITKSLKEFSSTAKTLGYDQQEYFSMLENSVQFGVSAGGSEQYLRSQTINANRTMLGYDYGASLSSRLGMAPPALDRQGALNAHMFNAAAMDVDSNMVMTNAHIYKLQEVLSPEEMTSFLGTLEGLSPKQTLKALKNKSGALGIKDSAIEAVLQAGHYSGSGIRNIESYTNKDAKAWAEQFEDKTLEKRVIGTMANNLARNNVEDYGGAANRIYQLTDKLGIQGAKVMLGTDYKAIDNLRTDYISRIIDTGKTREEAESAWGGINNIAMGISRAIGKKAFSAIAEVESLNPVLTATLGGGLNSDLEGIKNRREKMYGGIDMSKTPSKGISGFIENFLSGDEKYAGRLDALALSSITEGQGALTMDVNDLYMTERLGRDYDPNAITEAYQKRMFESIQALQSTGKFGTDHVFSGIRSFKDITGRDKLKEIADAFSTENLRQVGWNAGITDDGRRIIAYQTILDAQQQKLVNEKLAKNPLLDWTASRGNGFGLYDVIEKEVLHPKFMGVTMMGTPIYSTQKGLEKEFVTSASLKANMDEAKLNESQQAAITKVIEDNTLKAQLGRIEDGESLDSVFEFVLRDLNLDPKEYEQTKQFLKSTVIKSVENTTQDPKALAKRLLSGDQKELYSLTDNPVYAEAFQDNLTNMLDALAKSGDNLGFSDRKVKKIKEKAETFRELSELKSKNNPSDLLSVIMEKLDAVLAGNAIRVTL